MKTAQDLVLQAKANVREIPLQDADEAIRQADVLLDRRNISTFKNNCLRLKVVVK